MDMHLSKGKNDKENKFSFGDYLLHGRLAPLIWGAFILIALYALYFAFSFNLKPLEGNADKDYWNNWRHIALRAILALNALGCLAFLIVLRLKNKLTTGLAALLIGGMASSMILSYSFGTPIYGYGTTFNQHDLYYNSPHIKSGVLFDYGSGHHGIIMTIFKTGKIPGLLPDGSGGYRLDFSGVLERYQPKLFYIISAWFMRFNDLFFKLMPFADEAFKAGSVFTMKDWALFESLRILYSFMEIAQLYLFYILFKAMNMKGLPLIIAYSLLSFMPIWCYFAHWANNDGMCFFFAVLALYFTAKFLNTEDWLSVCMIALSIGLSMSCKLGGALAAIMIAPVLVYVLIRSITRGTWKKTLLQALVFSIIVFPIGLFWPMYNKILYGQPIAFFSEVPNDTIRIHNESIFERFILFPNKDVFKMIWVYHSYGDAKYSQDTSLITALIKTTLYGEYGFGRSSIQMGAIYVVAIALYFGFFASLIYLLVLAIKRKELIDWKRSAFFGLMFIVSYGWAVYFVQAHPFTCNEDIRYIPFILIPFAGFIAMSVEGMSLSSCKVEKTKERFSLAVSIIAAIFVFVVLVGYLTVSPWYYRVG